MNWFRRFLDQLNKLPHLWEIRRLKEKVKELEKENEDLREEIKNLERQEP